MLALPPGRFSTTTLAPSLACSTCPARRPIASFAAPAGNGTMMRIAWARGHCVCANAGAASAAAEPARKVRRFILSLYSSRLNEGYAGPGARGQAAARGDEHALQVQSARHTDSPAG